MKFANAGDQIDVEFLSELLLARIFELSLYDGIAKWLYQLYSRKRRYGYSLIFDENESSPRKLSIIRVDNGKQ